MTIKQVKQIFFENVHSFNTTYGFKSKVTAFCLVRKEQDKTIKISFTYNSFYDEIELIPCLEIYLHDVESYTEKCFDEKKATIAIDLLALEVLYKKGEKYIENYVIERKNRFHIFEDTDIVDAMEKMMSVYDKYAQKYIDTYANLEAVNKLFNIKPKVISQHHTAWEYQAASGVIVAKLLNENFEKVLKTYYELFKRKSPWGIEEFECLKDILSIEQ